jgi:hypothetical protein
MNAHMFKTGTAESILLSRGETSTNSQLKMFTLLVTGRAPFNYFRETSLYRYEEFTRWP